MPYQNDMSTLADVVGPAYAAQQAGIQNDLANQEQELANQKSQAQLPYVAPQAQADVDYKNASAGLLNQQGNEVGLKNLFTQATQPSEIQATNAGNQNKYTAAQVQNIGLLGQMAGQLAGQLDNIPEAARPAFMHDFLQSRGIDPSAVGPLVNGDPDQMRQFSQKAIQASSDYQMQILKGSQDTERAENVAGIQSNARVTSAEATANARVQAANISAKMHQQMLTAEQAAVQARQSGNMQLANQYAQLAENLRQAQAGITGQLVGQPMPQAFGNGGSNPNMQAPQGPSPTAQQTPQGTVSDGTYEYRQTADGQWQRRKLAQ